MDMASKWRPLGLSLRLKPAQLDTISSKNHTGRSGADFSSVYEDALGKSGDPLGRSGDSLDRSVDPLGRSGDQLSRS